MPYQGDNNNEQLKHDLGEIKSEVISSSLFHHFFVQIEFLCFLLFQIEFLCLIETKMKILKIILKILNKSNSYVFCHVKFDSHVFFLLF